MKNRMRERETSTTRKVPVRVNTEYERQEGTKIAQLFEIALTLNLT